MAFHRDWRAALLGAGVVWALSPPAGARPLILGHRGYSARYLENSLEAFRAALDAGMDGFELDAQPSADGVSCVLHDDDFGRTARGRGRLRHMETARFPRLRNGERVPALAEVLRLPSALVNVELKGAPGWREALEAVQAAGALERVLFSSFDHGEIHRLRQACPGARCGLLWERGEAARLGAAAIARLPGDFMLHLPLEAVLDRPGFWRRYARRLVLWGLRSPRQARPLGFAPAAMITDGL